MPKYLTAVPPDPTGRRQYSFSRLSGGLHARGRRAPPATARDAEGPATLDPLGLGTLVHAVLAEADFARPDEVRGVGPSPCLASSAGGRGGVGEPIELIERFLASPRGAAMAAAAEVHREMEFLLAWPPDRPDPEGHVCKDSSTVSIATRRTAGG